MPKVKDVIESLKEYDQDEHIAAAIWSEDDVLTCAKELGIKITREQAAELIDYIDTHEDCDLGITWETIYALLGVFEADGAFAV